MTWLEILVAGVTIVAGIIGIVNFTSERRSRAKQRCALENYLQEQKLKAPNGKKGQQTLMHLIKELGMTEAEILKASTSSRLIKRLTRKDPKSGDAKGLLFEYKSDNNSD